MPDRPDNHIPPERFDLLAGLPATLVFAVLLIGDFVLETIATTMPPSERWAALTTFALLALAYVLQGSVGLYDALGRVVRRDTRALVALVALVPALYVSYSTAVDEFIWRGLITALVFVALPTVALLRNRGRRTPTVLDFVAVSYLWLSLELRLVPGLQLPQQGGQVGFFFMSATPLLLLLLAARGWPGLGFTWFLSWSNLLVAVLTAVVVLGTLIPLALVLGLVQPAVLVPTAIELLGRAVTIYFFIALPQEIVFRGIFQNGFARVAQSVLRQDDGNSLPRRLLRPLLHNGQAFSLLLGSLLFATAQLNDAPGPGSPFVLAFLAGLGYGWVYQRTGKVTASAVTHLLVLWCWSIFFAG